MIFTQGRRPKASAYSYIHCFYSIWSLLPKLNWTFFNSFYIFQIFMCQNLQTICMCYRKLLTCRIVKKGWHNYRLIINYYRKSWKKLVMEFVMEFVHILKNPPWCMKNMKNNTFKLLDEYVYNSDVWRFFTWKHFNICHVLDQNEKEREHKLYSYILKPEVFAYMYVRHWSLNRIFLRNFFFVPVCTIIYFWAR